MKAQRGVAVITVLLALAIAVLISSEVIMRVYTGMKRSQNHFDSQQAMQYALGGEAWARQRLAMDLEKDKKQLLIDHFREEWAMPAQKLEIEGGSLEIEVYDMQSRFNLNNLIDENGTIVQEQARLFNNLLAYLGITTIYTDMAAHWASYADDTDNLYDSEKFPYRAANTQFGSVSELRQLRDMEMNDYQKMMPFLSALPDPVKININTASEPVLAALVGSGDQSHERIMQFMQRRAEQENGFTSPGIFISMMGIQDNELAELLSVNSEYFEVRVVAEYNGRRVWLISTLYRDAETGEISLLSRDTSSRFVFGNSAFANRSKDNAKDDGTDDGKKDKDDKANSRDKK